VHSTWRVWAVFVVLLLGLSACSGGGEQAAESESEAAEPATEEESEPASEGETTGRADADLVIWADETRVEPMEELAAQFEEEQGITVAVQELPFENIRDQVQVAGPAGEGPDVFIGAHDWLGELVANGAVAPVDLSGREGEFQEVAIEAVTVEGQTYGLPFAVENLAMFRNTEFVPEAPATFEEVVEIANRLEAEGTVEQGMVVPENPDASPYHNHPLYTGLGGYLFGELPDGGYDNTDVGLDAPEGLAAATTFADWYGSGFLDTSVDYQLMQELFGQGQAAFAITGPWALVAEGRGFSETGVPFEVTPIPPINGGTPQPFVGVQLAMISQFSENQLLAQTFVRDFLGTEEAALALFEANARPPALITAFESVAADDPVYQAFGEAGAEGQPLPSFAGMGAVFTAMGDAYALIANQEGDPQDAFRNLAEQVRTAVAEG
jgi:arabinogalactan oligomer / maltooligosaccharide transport system substrate-binding protein